MGTPSVASAAIVPAPSYPYLLSRSRMLVLVLMLLVGSSQGTSLERPERALLGGNAIDLQPAGLYGAPDACRPSTVYSTRVQYSTVVIPSTVYNNDVRYLTQTSVRTQQVFTTLYSEVVRPQVVQSVVYQTRLVTQTQDNVQTRVVTLPPQVSYVQRTQVVTRTQQLPGQTRVIPSTQYSTVYSTVFQPGQDVVRTSQVVRTNYVTQTVQQPGQTRYVTSTQVVPVTTTIFSQVVRTNTQTQYVTRTATQTQYSTVVRTQQVPQYNTRTVTVPQQVVRTQVSTQVVPTTIYSQQVVPSVVNLPAQTQYITVTQTSVRTQQLPGQTRTQYQTRTVYNTNYVTSTRYNQQYNTVTATRTIQPDCNTGGYNYQQPAIGFNALG